MPNNNMDRFTLLPDVLLMAIISLLPFKEAARTSILGRRLRFIWRATKNINFNESFFVKPEHSVQEKEVQRANFIAFAREWIENYEEPSVESFRLAFSDPTDFSLDMDRCIALATTRNVKFLVLDFSDPTTRNEEVNLEEVPVMYNLPGQFYDNGGVEFLQLFNCRYNVSNFRNFASLKHVSLGWIELDNLTLNIMLLYCPRIATLRLKKCWISGTLNISAPTMDSELTSLEIDQCCINQVLMDIAAPKLRLLKYTGGHNIFSFNGMLDEMVVADLDYGLLDEFNDGDGDAFYWSLQSLSSVRVLTVCSYILQVLPTGMEARFDPPLNVQHLALKTALHENDFFGITFFLRSCPYLQTLFIDLSPTQIFEDYESPCEIDPDTYWIHNVVADHCVMHTLKEVEIKGFKGTYNEIQFLHYILKYGRVMENLVLTLSRDSDDGTNVEFYRRNAQELMSFETASNILRLWISE